MVGFGGGSSYIALLAVAGTPYLLVPKISLVCNLLVVTGGCYHYWKKGYLKVKLAAPFVLSSVPFAFLGLSSSRADFYDFAHWKPVFGWTAHFTDQGAGGFGSEGTPRMG